MVVQKAAVRTNVVAAAEEARLLRERVVTRASARAPWFGSCRAGGPNMSSESSFFAALFLAAAPVARMWMLCVKLVVAVRT